MPSSNDPGAAIFISVKASFHGDDGQTYADVMEDMRYAVEETCREFENGVVVVESVVAQG